MNIIKEKGKLVWENIYEFLRWMALAVLTGLVVGGVGILFVKGLGFANQFRGGHPIRSGSGGRYRQYSDPDG